MAIFPFFWRWKLSKITSFPPKKKTIISLFGEISPGKTEKLQEGGVAC
jgi:hypothetical protein